MLGICPAAVLSAFAQHFRERFRRNRRGLGKPPDEPDRVRPYREQREIGKAEQVRALGKPGQVGGLRLGMAFGSVGDLHSPALYCDPGQSLDRHVGRRRRDHQQTHLRAQQHVLGMGRELTDMDDETRAAGKQGEGHHGHIRLALVKGSKGSHLLGSQQLAKGLGVGGIHAKSARKGHSFAVSSYPDWLTNTVKIRELDHWRYDLRTR